jgi:hypothetical protein
MDFEDYARLVNLVNEGEIQKACLIAYFLVRNLKQTDFTVRDITGLWGQLHIAQPNVSRLTRNIRSNEWFPRSVKKDHFRLHAERVRELDDEFADIFSVRTARPRSGGKTFVHGDRIEELRAAPRNKLDATRLIRICEEINTSYANDCLMAVALLARTLINHVPPVFGFGNFSEVANNYGGAGKGKSFKKVAQKLDESARNIGDMIAHEVMRSKESLPSAVQIDFSQELDVLLAEVIRLLH